MNELVPTERIEGKILLMRGQKVMLDRDLAELYGVPTKRLNEQVKRNIKRFPEDFMFQLTKEEFENWRSQIATSNSEKMGIRRKPCAFTEHGILMLSSVLNSERAIQVNIQIMRAFTKLRRMLATNEELRKKIKEHDIKFEIVFEAIEKLITPLPAKEIKIGFRPDEEGTIR